MVRVCVRACVFVGGISLKSVTFHHSKDLYKLNTFFLTKITNSKLDHIQRDPTDR